MAENRRGKDGRLYFSRGQMVLLGAAFILTSIIIFGLGVFVGKGIEGRRVLKKEEPLVKIPIKPSAEPAAVPAPAARTEITFNESATRPPVVVNTADERPAPKPSEKTAKADAAAKEAAKAAEKPEKASRLDEPKKIESADAAEAKDAGKVWRAQVNAFPDERSARTIVDRLKNKGYNAYVTEVQNRGKSWFRVSVGRYNSREEADKMAEQLRTKENYPKAFAASR